MALQMVVLATLLSSSHGMSPILAGLACSFLFKLSLNFNLIHQGCIDLCHGIRLLMYQMGQIPAVSISRGWQQTLHICFGRVMTARRSPAAVETSLHALNMLSLWPHKFVLPCKVVTKFVEIRIYRFLIIHMIFFFQHILLWELHVF